MRIRKKPQSFQFKILLNFLKEMWNTEICIFSLSKLLSYYSPWKISQMCWNIYVCVCGMAAVVTKTLSKITPHFLIRCPRNAWY